MDSGRTQRMRRLIRWGRQVLAPLAPAGVDRRSVVSQAQLLRGSFVSLTHQPAQKRIGKASRIVCSYSPLVAHNCIG
jgi:hypothetical protein